MNLTRPERWTLLAIHDGNAEPHRVSVLWSLVRRGLLTNDQRLTADGLRLAVAEATCRRDAQVTYMRDTIREHRRRFGG